MDDGWHERQYNLTDDRLHNIKFDALFRRTDKGNIIKTHFFDGQTRGTLNSTHFFDGQTRGTLNSTHNIAERIEEEKITSS